MGFLGVLKRFLVIKREQWRESEHLEQLQQERLEQVLASAIRTPYYSRKLAGHTAGELVSDFSSIPITGKEDVKRCEDGLIRKGVRKESLRKMHTSGSTGMPTAFYFDRDSAEHRAALNTLSQIEFGRSPLDHYMEISESTPNPFPLSSIGLFRKSHVSVFKDEAEMFSILKAVKPDILGWFPSILGILAKLNIQKGRSVRLKSVFSCGENLTPENRDVIEDSFSCPVFNQYGANEFGCIAWECPEEHNLHVNSTSYLIEILDGDGKPRKSGEGRIAVTSLFNHAMPLLRYSLGDRGSWGRECPCGRGLPVLASLDGREDDPIILPSGKIRSARSLNLLDNMTSIISYQVVQEEPGEIIFRYVPVSKGAIKNIQEEVAARMKAGCLNEELKIDFDVVDKIERGRTGKIQSFVSRVRPWER